MGSIRCKMIVKAALQQLGILYNHIDLGEVNLTGKLTNEQTKELAKLLQQSGLELMTDKKAILIEKISLSESIQ